MPAAIIGGLIAGVGSIGGAAIASSGAGNAASTQAQAANNAAQLQYQLGEQSLGFQQNVYNTEQQEIAPFLGAGQGAVTTLAHLLAHLPRRSECPRQDLHTPRFQASLQAAHQAVRRAAWPGQPGVRRSRRFSFAAGPEVLPGPVGASGTGAAPATTPTNVGGINYNFPTGGTTQLGSLLQPWNQQFQAPTAEAPRKRPAINSRCSKARTRFKTPQPQAEGFSRQGHSNPSISIPKASRTPITRTSTTTRSRNTSKPTTSSTRTRATPTTAWPGSPAPDKPQPGSSPRPDRAPPAA